MIIHLVKNLTTKIDKMRKSTFCIFDNKGADQLRGNLAADQRLCFRNLQSLLVLNTKFHVSASVVWGRNPKCKVSHGATEIDVHDLSLAVFEISDQVLLEPGFTCTATADD